MAEFDNRNRGSIWRNEKMREGKADPDFTGSLNVDGHDYWVSAWKRKEGANPKAPALSFSIKLKDGKPREEAKPVAQPVRQTMANADMDDEIPFNAEFR